MAVEIRQTILTPDRDGDVVQLHISDARLEDESASFVLTLSVKLGPFETSAMAHYQREAIEEARKVLERIDQNLTKALRDQSYPPFPRPAPPRG